MMPPIPKTTGLLLCLVCIAALAPAAPAAPAGKPAPTPPLLRQMVGTWSVRQRMWPGADAPATQLPPATASRQLIKGRFLEEKMTLAPGIKQPSFTRLAYLNYNAVTQKFEYFSMDTRAPQMMNERSVTPHTMDASGVLTLEGGTFVAPRWGKSVNAAFRYRLTVGPVDKNRQVVRLHLTPLAGKIAGGKAKEFVGFEYIYTRQ